MFKRISTILLAVLFILSCAALTACQNDKTKTDAPVKTPAAATATAGETKSESEEAKTETKAETETDKQTEETTEEPTAPEAEEPEFGTQEWIEWLINVDAERDDDATYYQCLSGGVYNIQHDDCESASPWEVLTDQTSFHMCYLFDREEIDLSANVGTEDDEYVWQIWYRDADEGGDFQKIETKPISVYKWAEGDILYRLPTYNQGMKDMALRDGETERDYEFVFVIYQGEELSPDNVFAWKLDYIPYTDSTEAFIAEAKELGYIS